MTNKEAVEVLSELGGNTLKVGSRGSGKSQMLLSFIEAINKAIEALKMRIPELPFYNGREYECPYCNTTMTKEAEKEKPMYCDICGQHLDWDLEKNKGEIVHCVDCKYLTFSDCYGECSRSYKGIVNPDDWCPLGELKDKYKTAPKDEVLERLERGEGLPYYFHNEDK